MLKLASAVFAVTLCLPVAAHAQPQRDVTGGVGLLYTPVGAFVPVVTGTPHAETRSTGLQLRASNWAFEGVDNRTTAVGAGLTLARGRSRTVLEVGYITTQRCADCGILLAGADVQVDLVRAAAGSSTIVAALNPAIGIGRPTEGSGYLSTVGLSLPLSASIDAGTLRVVPFVSPGFGVSRASNDGESSTGSRGMLAGGVSLGGQTSPLLVTVGARKIFLDGAPTIFGVGVVLAR